LNAKVEIICGVTNTVACDERPCALARANRVFRTDEKRIRTENTVMVNTKHSMGFYPRSSIARGWILIRAQSTIRADGFSSAQNRNWTTTSWRDLGRHVQEWFELAAPLTQSELA